MATFRFKLIVAALCCVACTPPSASEQPAAEVAAITRQGIDHVTPKRDFVGPAPQKLQWTAAAGVDSYSITVMNEVDALLVDASGITATSFDWPQEIRLEPGTYFWRVVGIRNGRSIADSGRSAFVVVGDANRR